MFNKLLQLFVYELICMLFGNNNLVWKLQLLYVGPHVLYVIVVLLFFL